MDWQMFPDHFSLDRIENRDLLTDIEDAIENTGFDLLNIEVFVAQIANKRNLSWERLVTPGARIHEAIHQVVNGYNNFYQLGRLIKKFHREYQYFPSEDLTKRIREHYLQSNTKATGDMRERFLNPDTDVMRSPDWLQQGYQACLSVAKITLTGGATGTGFLLSNRFLITNHHVVYDAVNQPRDFDSICVGYMEQQTSFVLKNPKVVYSHLSSNKDIDFAVISFDSDTTEKFATAKISKKKPQIDTPVFIPQHPHGKPMQITINNNKVAKVGEHTISYTAATDEGSSGSPVFDKNWQVIAVHFGYRGVDKLNHGTRIDIILDILRREQPGIADELEGDE